MTPRQFILPLAHELVVDLFAGGGVHQEVHRLVALQVDDAQGLSPCQQMGPGRPGGHHLVMDHGSGRRVGGAHRA